MSLESEDCSSLDRIMMDTSRETHKGSKILYTREFLLSLSELEICKNLPSGFNQSLLSEFEDGSQIINNDRLRTYSSSPFQGFRRTEYGSSPPTRGDSAIYSRGSYGRWDSRPSSRSERDSDSQSDKESESGKHYSNQSRKSWQGTEHDGLLGSGSFPRPSGYTTGIGAPKHRANDQYQLNRSNEPYHPPRPYKAAPFSRRDTDSFNDETFGSAECTSEDRAEEERRRRASFELMRKEQRKALHEKQKPNLEKPKADTSSDTSVLLDDAKGEKGVLDRDNDLDSTINPSMSSIDSGNCALPSQATSRPLVPPGFKSTVVEKTSGLISLIQSHSVENGTLGTLERKSLAEISLSREPPEDKTVHIPFMDKGEKIANSSLNSDVSSKDIGMRDFLHQTSILPEAHETPNEPETIKLNAEAAGLKLGGELHQIDATSILEKIFGNASTVNGSNSTDSVEHHDNKPDDSWSPKTVHLSKFARWFVEEERKTEDDLCSSRPNDLLSLIVGSDKQRNQADTKTFEHFPVDFPDQGTESVIVGSNKERNQVDMETFKVFPADFPDQRTKIAYKPTANESSATNGVTELLSSSNKQGVVPAILTCEDLEQTILSEYGEKGPNSLLPLEGWSLSGAKSEYPRAHVDNHASQHLLSLLQKGATQKDTTPKIPADTDPSKLQPASDVSDVGATPYKYGEEVGKNSHVSGETLTLETLFGTAFMKELKSVEAPVSVQRGSVGSAPAESLELQGLSLPVTDNDLFPSTFDQIELDKITNEKHLFASSCRQQVKMDKTEKWLGYDDPQIELNLPKQQYEVVPKRCGVDGSVEYHLPEEESLIASNEDLNAQLSSLMLGRNSSKQESSASSAPGDIAEKLAAIGAAIKDKRSTTGFDGPPFLCGPFNQMEHEIAYRDLHAQTSSSNFHTLQMSHGRPLIHQLDSHPAHMNSQMKFIGRESMRQHDAPANQQYPTNIVRPPFHQPNVGVTGFDHPAHNAMLQQMQMPGGFSPHMAKDFPRGAPVPHLGNQAPSLMQQLNPMSGYPFGPRQPNTGGLGMPLPVPDINGGSNHPDAFQRLVEMELRAKSKQIPPFAAGHSQAMYGHELDTGFHHR
ncbi:hypothetical protein ACH5RR_024111 [Cinchona calisaya]|uniref:Uncharacterized protein n=1 Tax=Cinchona calisaya TaxID=153742 RepID=A0ABD2ZDY2_9GENT